MSCPPGAHWLAAKPDNFSESLVTALVGVLTSSLQAWLSSLLALGLAVVCSFRLLSIFCFCFLQQQYRACINVWDLVHRQESP